MDWIFWVLQLLIAQCEDMSGLSLLEWNGNHPTIEQRNHALAVLFTSAIVAVEAGLNYDARTLGSLSYESAAINPLLASALMLPRRVQKGAGSGDHGLPHESVNLWSNKKFDHG
jgi:hypothetical protein